jgi:hypothetical protein
MGRIGVLKAPGPLNYNHEKDEKDETWSAEAQLREFSFISSFSWLVNLLG